MFVFLMYLNKIVYNNIICLIKNNFCRGSAIWIRLDDLNLEKSDDDKMQLIFELLTG